jgi:hypothetical protein
LIRFLTTRQHKYTHTSLLKEDGVEAEVLSFAEMEDPANRVPGTYIFTDLDRLPLWGLGKIAALYQSLRNRGYHVLNDPARTAGRFGLLRALNRAGINQFDAYRVEALETPRRWPVFLRVDGDHSAPVSDLLGSEAELDAAVEAAIQKGIPRSALLVIEYAAEPVQPGLFRKLSVFRIGDQLIGATCVHDDQWLVKYGKPGIAPDHLYEEEYGFVADNPFGDVLRRVFEIAAIDYGRADFGLIGGRPQIYEINSNPDVKLRPEPSSAPRRDETMALFRDNYLAALRALDQAAGDSAIPQPASVTGV